MRPNLFLIGAPKCGTSSLFDWLSRHPDIAASRVKEPFFLIDTAHPLSRRPNLCRDGMAAYAQLFAPDAAAARIRMEGTTHYIFDPVARGRIAAMEDARAVIVLREPAARIYSSFRYSAQNLARLRPGLDFTEFLHRIGPQGPLPRDACPHPGSAFVLNRELGNSRYHLHLAPWLQAMGRERVRVLLMEEMVQDPAAAVHDLLVWLGLDPAALCPFDAVASNRTQSIRWIGLHRLARKLGSHLPARFGMRPAVKRGYNWLQRGPAAQLSPADALALERLRQSYAADNAQLAALTGLDLACWERAGP